MLGDQTNKLVHNLGNPALKSDKCIAFKRPEWMPINFAIASMNDIGAAPDVIVSDYHLIGESTGVDTIVALRKLADTMIPAIIVTGDTSKLVNDACDVKNCAILSKPVDPDELISMATNAISTGVVPC